MSIDPKCYMQSNECEARAIAEMRRDEGIRRTQCKNRKKIIIGQIRLLKKALARVGKTCTSDDVAVNLTVQYRDKGCWVGAAIRQLSAARVIQHIGYVKSRRARRNGSDTKHWQIVDECVAREHLETLESDLSEMNAGQLETSISANQPTYTTEDSINAA